MLFYLSRFEQPLASGCKTRLPSEVLHSRFRDASCNGEERELLDCFANHPQTDTCKGDMVAAGVCGKPLFHCDSNLPS